MDKIPKQIAVFFYTAEFIWDYGLNTVRKAIGNYIDVLIGNAPISHGTTPIVRVGINDAAPIAAPTSELTSPTTETKSDVAPIADSIIESDVAPPTETIIEPEDAPIAETIVESDGAHQANVVTEFELITSSHDMVISLLL